MTRVRNFWIFERTVDQFRGDTCHHWKGDTWHRMMSASYVSDDVSSMRGDDVARVYWLVAGELGGDMCLVGGK
jgi:hypothetical protein